MGIQTDIGSLKSDADSET